MQVVSDYSIRLANREKEEPGAVRPVAFDAERERENVERCRAEMRKRGLLPTRTIRKRVRS